MSQPIDTGPVLWFSGLSGAGKSTLATLLADALQERGRCVQLLDGDDLRRGLCNDLGYRLCDRIENVRRAIHVAGLMSRSGATTLVTLITPLESMREMVKEHLPNSLQVFVDAPLSVCERRDPKGLYAKARAGVLKEFTGVDSPFERPLRPDLVCRTAEEREEALVTRLLALLDAKAKVLQHFRGREFAQAFVERTPQDSGRRFGHRH